MSESPVPSHPVSLVAREAPDFETTAVVGQSFESLKLSSYRGKWVLLFFYPLDFTFVCPTELLGLSERYDEFKDRDAVVLGCSVDSKFSHLTWMKQPIEDGGVAGLRYPLLEDLGGAIAQKYGVYVGRVALRAMFLIDPEGIVQHSTVNNLSVGRSVDETLRVLQAFQWVATHGDEVCPMDWSPGATTMKPTEPGKKAFFARRSSR